MKKTLSSDEIYRRLVDTLSKEQLAQYLKLFASSYYIARHDIGNPAITLIGFANLLKKDLDDIESKVPTEMFEKLNSYSQQLIASSIQLRQQLYGFFNLYAGSTGIGDAGLLLASPWRILAAVQALYSSTTIQVSPKSPKTLAIPFPNSILYGILSELVKNSVRHAGAQVEVRISWKITGEGFLLLVADSGQRIAQHLDTSFIPIARLLELLTPQNRDGGLYLISTAMALTGGSVLFSRSRTSGGLLARVQIPVAHYLLRGRLCQIGHEPCTNSTVF